MVGVDDEFATYGRRQRVVWVSHMTVELGEPACSGDGGYRHPSATATIADRIHTTCPLSTWPTIYPIGVGCKGG